MIDEKIVEAVARAILKARYFDMEPEAYGHSLESFFAALEPEHYDGARDEARAAITAYQAEAWQDISTAPTLERVFVAGWQPQSGNVQGYWWFYEDTTDENGRPMDHPAATKWQTLPPAPKATP